MVFLSARVTSRLVEGLGGSPRIRPARLSITVSTATAAPGLVQHPKGSAKHASQAPTLHKSRRKSHSQSAPVVEVTPVSNALAAYAACRALVLDSSYRPIDIVPWQRAICLDLFDKVDVLEYFEDLSIRSARTEHMIPAVMRVRFYVKRTWKSQRLSLSRRNLMLRDRYMCQYCGSRSDLTLDHVKPASKGGKFSWENMVTCCQSCNSRKGNSTLRQLGWKLRKQPVEPTANEVAVIAGMGFSEVRRPPKEWSSYLFPGHMPLFPTVTSPDVGVDQ